MGQSPSDSKFTFICTQVRELRLKAVYTFLFDNPVAPSKSYFRTELVEVSTILKGPSVSIVKTRLV
jgi:hypothetical protein